MVYMGYNIKYEKFSSIFAVPYEVAASHLNSCGVLALKVIIYILSRPQEEISIEEISLSLSADKYDIKDALNYWTAAGILGATSDVQTSLAEAEVGKNQIKEAYNKLNIKTIEQPMEPLMQCSDTETAVANQGKEVPTVRRINENKVSIITSRPKMDRQDIISLARRDNRVGVLVNEAQSKLGKTLSHAEIESLVSLYNYSGMPVEFLLMVIGYCVSINKGNVNYITKTAIGWSEKGIDTLEKAEVHIQKLSKRNSDVVQVKTAFGIYDRALSEREIKCIDCWFNKFGYDISMIRLAYERTVNSIQKVSFPYIDKILSNWYEKGIRTTEQASQEAQPQKPTGKEQFAQSSFDINALDRLITYGNNR